MHFVIITCREYNNVRFLCSEDRGMYDEDLFEGDMILSPEQKVAAYGGRGSITSQLWPNGVVPYTSSIRTSTFCLILFVSLLQPPTSYPHLEQHHCQGNRIAGCPVGSLHSEMYFNDGFSDVQSILFHCCSDADFL